MIRTLDLRGRTKSRSELERVIPRAEFSMEQALPQAEKLITDVQNRGVAALIEQAERFDRVTPQSIRITPEALNKAVANLDPQVREALEAAIHRVRLASAEQVPEPRITQFAPGAVIEQRWVPVERAGVYIPGGKAVYPSSVVMNVVAAQAAGVQSIALASPAQAEFGGEPHPTILAAAALLGVTEVFAMGGAGAIGALAHGVAEIDLDPVDTISGPGNIFVAAAKRLVSSHVGIDSEAGPTEILIIADEQADPAYIAADLLSQAEHDELAAAVLVTDSANMAELVAVELERQIEYAPNRERAQVALAGPQSAMILCDSLSVAVQLSNAYAPEHLQVMTADPDALLGSLKNAGAIFLGSYSPVSVGDYLAGSNHVLPTGGQARYRAGLSAITFLKPQQIIRYDREGLAQVGAQTQALARAEGLDAHAEAIAIRSAQPTTE